MADAVKQAKRGQMFFFWKYKRKVSHFARISSFSCSLSHWSKSSGRRNCLNDFLKSAWISTLKTMPAKNRGIKHESLWKPPLHNDFQKSMTLFGFSKSLHKFFKPIGLKHRLLSCYETQENHQNGIWANHEKKDRQSLTFG